MSAVQTGGTGICHRVHFRFARHPHTLMCAFALQVSSSPNSLLPAGAVLCFIVNLGNDYSCLYVPIHTTNTASNQQQHHTQLLSSHATLQNIDSLSCKHCSTCLSERSDQTLVSLLVIPVIACPDATRILLDLAD